MAKSIHDTKTLSRINFINGISKIISWIIVNAVPVVKDRKEDAKDELDEMEDEEE